MPPQSAKMSLQGRREYHATLQSATRPTSGENREPRDTRTTTQNPGYSVYRGDPRNTGRTTTLARKPRHATSSAVEASCYEKCCMCACCPFGGGLSNKQETAEPTDRETVVRDSDFVVSADGMQYADEADDLESARRNKKKRNMTNYGTLVFEGADGEQRSTTNKSTNKSGLIFGAGSSSTTSKNYGNATFSGENSSLVGAPVQVKTSVESEGLDDVAEQLLQWRREQAKPRAHLSASSDTDHYSNFAPMKMSHIEDHEEEDNQVDAGGSGSSLLEFDGEDDDDENDVQPPGDDLDHMEKQFREFQLHHHQPEIRKQAGPRGLNVQPTGGRGPISIHQKAGEGEGKGESFPEVEEDEDPYDEEMKALRVFEDEELLREAETALDKQRVLTVNLQYAEDQEYASKKRKGNGQSGASFRSTSSSSNEDSDSSSSSSSSSSDEEEEPVIEPEEAERIKRIVDGPRRQQELQVTRNSSSSTTRTTSSTRVSSAFAAPDTDGDPTDNGFQEAAPSPEDMSPVRVLPKPPPGTTRPSKPIIGFATRNSNSAKDKKLFDGAGGGAAQPKKL